ncbi:CPBP family intramembrane metalloprotease [Blastococcus sp. VKM Ac-2987]|nr:CPBP family intramembrane glutamic endopeptidase [Blastococcus sp. VKM Ac-2987]MCZ2860859.1 CPBP family intramembrane metalloprotease [Blastococcus sp. VKM Ac-2987]
MCNAADGLRRWLSPRRAVAGGVAVSSIVFGLDHLGQAEIPAFILTWILAGVVFGVIYVYSGNLALVIGAHATYNITYNAGFSRTDIAGSEDLSANTRISPDPFLTDIGPGGPVEIAAFLSGRACPRLAQADPRHAHGEVGRPRGGRRLAGAGPQPCSRVRRPTVSRPQVPSAFTGDDQGDELAHVEALRADFARHAGRSLALPLAGAFVWAVVGIVTLFLPASTATLVLPFATGAIFPLGMVIAQRLGERLLDNPSVLAGLTGRCVIMVNLLWAVHLTVFALAPSHLPLTLGIGLGLHWVAFGWIIGHPLGLVHAIARTLSVTAAWWLVPDHRISAVAAAVVISDGYALCALATRPLTEAPLTAAPAAP